MTGVQTCALPICQEEVAKALALQRTFGEAVMQQLSHERLHVGQGLQAVAHISGRQHPKLLAQDAGAAAIVRYRDNGSQSVCVPFQAAQHGGKACSSANGGDPGAFAAGAPVKLILIHRHF